jgi:hypothetical protein
MNASLVVYAVFEQFVGFGSVREISDGARPYTRLGVRRDLGGGANTIGHYCHRELAKAP